MQQMKEPKSQAKSTSSVSSGSCLIMFKEDVLEAFKGSLLTVGFLLNQTEDSIWVHMNIFRKMNFFFLPVPKFYWALIMVLVSNVPFLLNNCYIPPPPYSFFFA